MKMDERNFHFFFLFSSPTSPNKTRFIPNRNNIFSSLHPIIKLFIPSSTSSCPSSVFNLCIFWRWEDILFFLRIFHFPSSVPRFCLFYEKGWKWRDEKEMEETCGRTKKEKSRCWFYSEAISSRSPSQQIPFISISFILIWLKISLIFLCWFFLFILYKIRPFNNIPS